MKRIALSLMIGVLTAALGLVLVHLSLDREAKILRTPALHMPHPAPTPVVRPAPRNLGSLLSAWRDAQESQLESLVLLEGLQTEEVLALLAALESGELHARIPSSTRQRLFDRLVDCDRKAALTFAEKFPFKERLSLTGYLIERWSFENPDGCWDWYEAQGAVLSEKQHVSLWRRIADARSNSAPVAREITLIWETIEGKRGSLSSSIDAKRNLWPLVYQARESGTWAETAQRIVASREHPNTALWPVMQQWLDHDLEGATAWVASLPPGEERSAMAEAMTYDPNKVAYQGQFDRSRLFDALLAMGEDVGAVITNWSGVQPIEAGDWLAAHPAQTPALERARWEYAKSIARVDSQAAMEWAASIADESRRERTLRDACRRWYWAEPWAAQDWARENLGWGDAEFDSFLW